jgi:hypothetical protein
MHIKGFTYGFDCERGDLRKPASFESLEKLRATGADWVCLAFIVYQKKYSDTEIYFDYRNTVTDKDLAAAIENMHKMGMKVCLKPVINCHDDVWRARINFPDEDDSGSDRYWNEWFEFYNAFLCHYAEIAADTGCEMFCVGCEMEGTERKESHWRETIRQVREIYEGPITYNTNHGDEDNVRWFDAVDYLGVSAYYPVADGPGATEDEMYERWQEHKHNLKELYDKWNKPILFAEVGCRSAAGCAAMPWDYLNHDFPYCEEEQARFYASCLRTFFDEPWFAGFFWWHWSHELYEPGDTEGYMGFDVYNKKAERVLREWYAKK